MKMDLVAIIFNSINPEAVKLAEKIYNKISPMQNTWIIAADDIKSSEDKIKKTDLIITVGGDGTILRANRVSAKFQIPILGINMGRLGFMTELTAEEALDHIEEYLIQPMGSESRNMLQSTIVSKTFEENKGPHHALNDIVLARGTSSRVVTIRVKVDGADLTVFRSDAVIVSSATGSTGYNLSVGGPILDPLSNNIIIKPVAAHIGLSTGIVLNYDSSVEMIVEGEQSAIMSIDGSYDYPLIPGDTVIITQSNLKAQFVRSNPSNHFYKTLTRRLGFGLDRSRAVRY
ncbi:MAG TPA: hypothetical protein DEZ08_06110 [Dehalococcoidia bacterium]|jgi:NAD+ kinase|nr:hypothetical protein [Dehalococcoidia bacterium]|tara:strand:+ start:225 stop:1088 length:864 start_codon:yes stop_codon:yes gene_type:complete